MGGQRAFGDGATDARREASRLCLHGQRIGEGVLSNMNSRQGDNGASSVDRSSLPVFVSLPVAFERPSLYRDLREQAPAAGTQAARRELERLALEAEEAIR